MVKTTLNSLYVHIPFCTKKCGYCHFFVIKDEKARHETYIEALKKEWALYLLPNLISVYFGGGTPSLIEGAYFQELLTLFNPFPHAEITLEANPELLTKEKLESFRKAGINRLSIGVQSFDDSHLSTLTRTHNSAKAQETILLAKECGFDNISIDLMFDLPGQTLESWQRSLDIAVGLPITHLSLYNLTIEAGTLFHKQKKQLPPDDPIYLESAVKTLEEADLKRYEISAFARHGYKAVHNTGYWTGRPFIGLGPSAFSYFHGKRFQNICHYNRYLQLINEGVPATDFSEELPPEKAKRELFAIHLRLLEGALLPEGIDITSLEKQGLLKRSHGNLVKLTPLGLLHYDTVASEIV